MSIGVERYFRQLEEADAFKEKSATRDRLELAYAAYESAKKELENYRIKNPDKWQEFLQLEREYLTVSENWPQNDYEKQIRPAQESYQEHTAWSLLSQEVEAMVHYLRLKNDIVDKNDADSSKA